MNEQPENFEEAMSEAVRGRGFAEDLNRWTSAALEEKHKEAVTDPLTELLNRRGFEEKLSELKAKGLKHGAVLVLDLDNFKSFNDTYGHLTGDNALKAVAHGLQNMLRTGGGHDYEDLAARFGGEEFVVLFSDTDALKVLRSLEEKNTDKIARIEIPFSVEVVGEGGEVKSKKHPITFSGGMVDFNLETDNLQQKLDAADKLLYDAKSAGKNQIAVEI